MPISILINAEAFIVYILVISTKLFVALIPFIKNHHSQDLIKELQTSGVVTSKLVSDVVLPYQRMVHYNSLLAKLVKVNESIIFF